MKKDASQDVAIVRLEEKHKAFEKRVDEKVLVFEKLLFEKLPEQFKTIIADFKKMLSDLKAENEEHHEKNINDLAEESKELRKKLKVFLLISEYPKIFLAVILGMYALAISDLRNIIFAALKSLIL